MIEFLRIRNLALIDDLELEFGPGLNVLSGETGAGKSFIIGAVNFLAGERMGPDMVRAGREKAVVEALFVLCGEEISIRRELQAATGRGRVTVNGELATIETLKSLRPRLLLHVSQHGQQRLLQPAFQARLLDSFLPDQVLLTRKADLAARLGAVGAAIGELRGRLSDLESKREFLEFQKAEIDRVRPAPGEEDELLAKRAALGRTKKAEEAARDALERLLGEEGLLAALSALRRDVAALAEIDPGLAADATAVEEARLTLRDLSERLRGLRIAGAEDPEAIERRLFELSQLRRKLKKSLPEIIGLGREIEENLGALDVGGLDLARMGHEEEALGAELAECLERLDAARSGAALTLARALEEALRGLGFSSELRVLFEFTDHPILTTSTGRVFAESRARLLWRPNPGQPPQPLDRIASGGELSRFLLAVTGLRAEENGPTLIFDEIDSGIGGLTLGRVGERLKALSGDCQLVVITHWPQLAALADRHFQVRKEVLDGQTHTRCSRLTGPAIRAELSRMAGGGETGKAMAERLTLPFADR